MNEEQIKTLAEALHKTFGSKAGGEKELSLDEKREMLKAIASDDEAREAYIKSRAQVLLPLVPVQSTVRRIFATENLAPGAQATYPINFDYTEVGGWLPKLGGVFTQVVEGDEIIIPTFGIQAAVRWSMDIAKDGRVDIAENATAELGSRITAKEEFAGWATITGVFGSVNTDQTVYCSGQTGDGGGTPENFQAFTKKAVALMLTQMDIQRRELTDIYASPRSIHEVKQWSSNQIDFTTEREIFQNGGLPGTEQFGPNGGVIWNINLNKVYDSNIVPDSEAWGFDSNKFGKMPIREELNTHEDPTAILNWQVGVLARERVGFGVTDSYAVVKAIMDATHTTVSCTTF